MNIIQQTLPGAERAQTNSDAPVFLYFFKKFTLTDWMHLNITTKHFQASIPDQRLIARRVTCFNVASALQKSTEKEGELPIDKINTRAHTHTHQDTPVRLG